jgi:hypothetical protein
MTNLMPPRCGLREKPVTPPGEDAIDSVPHLTEAYQKTRRSYGFFAALLVAWELIGFDVESVPLSNVNIQIKSPEAIPIVLMVLIIYFGIRSLQEWLQCDGRRRVHVWALSDYALASGIAALAFILWVTQRTLEGTAS